MKYQEIKDAMEGQGCSFSLLAETLEKTTQAIRCVAKGTTTSKPIALAICKVLEKTPEKVFPNTKQYHTNFNPALEKQAQIAQWRERLSA
jgi:hypothetical protein